MVASSTVLIEHEILNPKTETIKVTMLKLWLVYYISGIQIYLLSTRQILQSRLRVKDNKSGFTFYNKSGYTILLVTSNLWNNIQIVRVYILLHTTDICTLSTLFWCKLHFIPINPRTKPYIPHQSHRVLNNNSYSIQQFKVYITREYYYIYTFIFKNVSYYIPFLSLIINLDLCHTCLNSLSELSFSKNMII